MLNRPTFGGHISLSGSICWFLLLHPRWLSFRGLLPVGAAVGWESVGFNLYTIDEKPFSFG